MAQSPQSFGTVVGIVLAVFAVLVGVAVILTVAVHALAPETWRWLPPEERKSLADILKGAGTTAVIWAIRSSTRKQLQ